MSGVVTVTVELNGVPVPLTLGPEALAAIAAALPDERAGSKTWLTYEEAAERLGCSVDAVRMRARRGRLETRRMGRNVLVSRGSVDGL